MKTKLVTMTITILIALAMVSCAKKNEIVMYANITAVEPILADFETQTGITVEYARISATEYLDIVYKGHADRSLKADVFQAPITILDQLALMGFLSPYTSAAAIDFPDWAKRESEGIYKFAVELVGMVYNADFVAPDDIPNTYQDLTEPKWKDKIVMPYPATHPTTISWLLALKEHVFDNDDTQWQQFLKGLAANKPLFVESFTPSAAVLASGERYIGISMPKYVITNKDSSLDWVRTENMMGSLRGIGISAYSKNTESARQFIDYWLSDDVGIFLANEVGEYVLVPDVYPPLTGIKEINVIPIRDLDDEETARWGEYFKEIFGNL